MCWSLYFDEAAGWRPETLLKRDFSTDLFLCIFWNTWCELLDILLLLFDIFWWCCCCWCCHINLQIKSSLTPLGRRKAASTLLAAIFRIFVYVLLKFDWLIIFLLENPPRKLKILNFFFLSSFSSRFFKCRGCIYSFLKLGGIYSARAAILTEWKTTLKRDLTIKKCVRWPFNMGPSTWYFHWNFSKCFTLLNLDLSHKWIWKLKKNKKHIFQVSGFIGQSYIKINQSIWTN